MKFLFLILAVAAMAQPIAEDRSIRVDVGSGPTVTVTVPNIRKEDVADVLSVFFSRGDESAKAQFQKILGSAKQVTLILESQRTQ